MINMKKVHKYIAIPNPTKQQPDAVRLQYLCNQACKCNWKKTDISNRRINCKNCKQILKKQRR